MRSSDELVEVEERLDHEEVDATPGEQLRLLGEERRPFLGPRLLVLPQRADRAGDEDLASRDLPAITPRAQEFAAEGASPPLALLA